MTATLYKFLDSEGRSPTGTGAWRHNRWRSVQGELVACRNGLHATTADNLLPFLDAQLWRVEIDGEHLWHTDASMGRKLVARRMRIVERIDAWNDRTARLFAADCAERVLPLFERERPDDVRPREAIAVARRFAVGEATRDELAAARDAAGAAAWDAAWDAARSAARSAAGAAARDADGVAARAAARAAVWDAAWDAAWATARDAAWDADRATARAAERQRQARHLDDMLGLPSEEAQP